MNATAKVLLYALATTGLLFQAGARADVRLTDVNGVDSADVRLHGQDVVITAEDGSEALITPAGGLSIDGKPVSVSASQRGLLRQYSAGMLDIQERGIRIGERAVDMVGGMVGTLVTDLMEGGDDKQMDKDMKAKAEPVADEARALCTDVKSERQLQEEITAALPAFRPYAVIDTDSGDNCHVDADDKD